MGQSVSPIKGWRSLDWNTPETTVPLETLTAPETVSLEGNETVSWNSNSICSKEPAFSRTPRKHIPYPREELVIQPPPAAPNPPSTSPFAIILPVIGSLIGIAISVFATTSMGKGAIPIYAFVSLPMMLFSIGGGLYNYFNQKKKYDAATDARDRNYRSYLIAQKTTLAQWSNEQLNANLVPNPDAQACVRLAEDRGLRLWEREPHDDDFLYLRLGLGNSKPTFKLRVPDIPPGAIQPDSLLVESVDLYKQYQTIPNTAIQLPLKDTGAAGIVGSKNQIQNTARALVTQLCTHHSPDEVKMVLVIPDQEEEEWKWARWLPHIWNNEKTLRYLLSNDASKHAILFALEEMIHQREYQSTQKNNNSKVKDTFLPRFIFIFADQKIWTGNEKDAFSPLLDLILTRGADLGIYSLFFTERHDRIPKDCKATVDLTDPNGSGILTISASGENNNFQPDRMDRDITDHFARVLASIQLETLSGAEHIPSRASIADLFDRLDVDGISIEKLWNNSKPTTSLAIPFGLRGGGKKAKIDLQDTNVGGFGSHALVGGTTGTGKTQFLQTLILLLAAHYRPTDLQFVLIDFKGGNLALGLEQLPHIVSSLTNIESQGNQTDLVQRLFDSMEVECQRRQRLLNENRVNNIIEYANKYASFPLGTEWLSELFIIIDEFAELLIKNPGTDLMKRLISIGQVGRYVGIHLILATQNPGTVIHEDLRNVLNTRICLRMGSREASNQILRRSDAFDNITKDQVGRAYIQVGNNDIFELLQVAWGGAPNNAAGLAPVSHIVRLVGLDGSRDVITTQSNSTSFESQIAVLTRKIIETASLRGYQRQPGILLPLLPTNTDRGRLCGSQLEFDGQKWPYSSNCTPIIGILDDPRNRRQECLTLDFSANPHLLIFGSPSTGKTTLLQTLLVGLTSQHSPSDLNAYIIDFGGRNFNRFERLPHIGAVITTGENERIRRLMNYITFEAEQRRERFEFASVKTINDYRKKHNDAPAEIFILIDNYAVFHDTFVKNQMNTPELDSLAQVVSEGGNLGIHLVISSGIVTGFPTKILDKVPMSIALELNNPLDYSLSIGRLNGIQPTKGIQGRGLIKLPIAGQKPRLLEFQAALPVSGDSEYERNEEITQKVDQMVCAWQEQPGAYLIPPLQKLVPLTDILPDQPHITTLNVSSACLPIGRRLAAPNLSPFTVSLEDGPHFWIAGPAYSGKSSLLQTWLVALADQFPADRLYFFIIDLADAGISRLKELPHCIGLVTDKEALKAKTLQCQIEEAISAVLPKTGASTIIIVIDDFGMLNKNIDNNTRAFLTEIGEQKRLMKEGLNQVRIHIIATGAPNDFMSSTNNTIADPIKRGRTGFLVGSSDNNAIYGTFGFKLAPTDSGRQMSVGQGFYFLRGQSQPVQFAICRQNDKDWNDWVQRIRVKANQMAVSKKKASHVKKAEGSNSPLKETLEEEK